MDVHISWDGTSGAPRGSITEERHIHKEDNILGNQTPDGTTIDVGRGGFCNTQRGGGQGAAANKGASALGFPADLAPSR